MLPNFIDIGPGRSGSSWLYEVLSSHPQVCTSAVKETEFFNTEFERGLSWYETFFKPGIGQRAVGEISNNYYLDPAVASRIRTSLPQVRLILHLRNPYELLASFYSFGIRRGLELPPLEAALDEPIGPIMGSGYAQREKLGRLTAADRVTLLDSVLLHERLAPFLSAFPEGDVYPFVFDRIRVEPEALAADIFRFLKVADTHRPESLRAVVNPTLEPRSRVLANVASTTAYYLRQARLDGVLQGLHGSRALKRILFRQPPRKDVTETRAKLPKAVVRRIDAEIEALTNAFPTVTPHWA
jgi:hypothetical protein